MVLQPFQESRNTPSEQAFATGDKPIFSGTIGPNASLNDYKNPFVADLNRNNPPAKGLYQQVFSADSAAKAQDTINKLGTNPTFPDPRDNAIAKDFLDKYAAGAQSGLVNNPITSETLAALRTENPGEGVRPKNVVAAHKMDIAGSGGVSTS